MVFYDMIRGMKKIILTICLCCGVLFCGNQTQVRAQGGANTEVKQELTVRKREKKEIPSASQPTQLNLSSKNYDELLKENFVAEKIGDKDTIASGRTILQDNIKLGNMLLGIFAIVWLFFLGTKFVVSQGNEEKMAEYKKQVGWLILGLAAIAAAEFAAFKIFDPAGFKILGGDGAVNNFNYKIMQIKTYFEYFVVSVMLVSLLISGYSLVVRFDNDEVIANEKKFVTSFIFGMGLILLAEVAVKIISVDTTTPGEAAKITTTGIQELGGIINFGSTFLGVSAVFMLILSSIYYIVSLGSEDQTSRAKNIIIGSVLGIVIAVSSYAISMFLI